MILSAFEIGACQKYKNVETCVASNSEHQALRGSVRSLDGGWFSCKSGGFVLALNDINHPSNCWN